MEKQSVKLQIFNKQGVISTLLLFAILVAVITAAFLFLNRSQNSKIHSEESTAKSAQNIKIASPEAQKLSPKPSQITTFVTVQNSGKQLNVPILTYHYIGNNPNPADTARDALSVSPDKFDAQMGILQKHLYTPITLDTMYSGLKGTTVMPAKPIILTFDDGYIDFYINAFPILRKYGFHAVSFIPTALISQGYYMSWDQIKEIDSTGLVSFQAHSVSHLNLASLGEVELKNQLIKSKADLETNLGKPVNFLAYPMGSSNSFVWEETRQAGYLGAVGTYYGTIESEGNIFNMPRIKVSGAWSDEEFSRNFP